MLLTRSTRKNLGPLYPVLIQSTREPSTRPAGNRFPLLPSSQIADLQCSSSSGMLPAQTVDLAHNCYPHLDLRSVLNLSSSHVGHLGDRPLRSSDLQKCGHPHPGQLAIRSLQAREPQSRAVSSSSWSSSQLWTRRGTPQPATTQHGLMQLPQEETQL